MTPQSRQKLKTRLVKEESYRQFPYVDSRGFLTIAIGRNISPTGEGVSLDEALYLLDNDIDDRYNKLSHFFPWFLKLNEARQIALVDMSFCTGWEGFLKFHNMLFALQSGDNDKASDEIINSKWEQDHKERATNIANIVRTGDL